MQPAEPLGRVAGVTAHPVLEVVMRLAPLLRLVAASALLTPLLPGTAAQAAAPAHGEAIVWSKPTGLFTDYELFIMRPDGTS